MSLLSMISLPLDLRIFRELSARRGFTQDEGRALHSFLSETYGKSALQPFRLMVGSTHARNATLYAYTVKSRTELLEAHALSLPELSQLFPKASLAMKSMPENWTSGSKLAFDVRVRPVRRLKQPIGSFTKVGAEVDAWLLANLHAYPEGAPVDHAERTLREKVYTDWLGERFGEAASIVSARLTQYQRTRAQRKGMSEGPDATFQGELIIKDGAAFAEKLRRGVGRHSAYGYGMLMLRPADRS